MNIVVPRQTGIFSWQVEYFYISLMEVIFKLSELIFDRNKFLTWVAGLVFRPQEGEAWTFRGVNCEGQGFHCPSFYPGQKGTNIKIVITKLASPD
jgi:hypothetical protein